jgi:PhzF family phenazine biosynthesis protein
MTYTLYQVDAFTKRCFEGNPAAVVPLDRWLSDATLQAIAQENNLPETAYFVPEGNGFRLRWFTPAAEVDLCGHATLASAWVLFHKLGYHESVIHFQTLGGGLRVSRHGERLRLDFPALHARPVVVSHELVKAVGAQPELVLESRDLLFVYQSPEQVRKLRPEMPILEKLVPFGLIATAPGLTEGPDACDFVSRFFAPAKGIPEDPATGSAHCTLAPFWAGRLGKTTFHARQISPRGGEIWCSLNDDRVYLEGHAVLYLEGKISLDGRE